MSIKVFMFMVELEYLIYETLIHIFLPFLITGGAQSICV